jgi:hypothetical protein
MCLELLTIRPYHHWNWSGSQIVHQTKLTIQRILQRDKKIINKFPIDIREFITNQDNAVIKDEIAKIVKSLPPKDRIKFYKNDQSNFDFRVISCLRSLSSISYLQFQGKKKKHEQWQLPEETLELKTGDCEDIAFLIASLLLSSGISDYCVRVAFGKVNYFENGNLINSYDHTWVMYQCENGFWKLVEPLHYIRITKESEQNIHNGSPSIIRENTKEKPMIEVEYRPQYVFNSKHLWSVDKPQIEENLDQKENQNIEKEKDKEFLNYIQSATNYFKVFDPGFSIGTHNEIFAEALTGISMVDLQSIINVSMLIDFNTLNYDPIEHFDFSYIDEGWKRIEERIKSKKVEDFAKAIHAIGDFYAHSTYVDIMKNTLKMKPEDIPIYNAKTLPDISNVKYNFSALGGMPGSDLTGCKVRSNRPEINKAEELWNGKIISGQWWRWFNTIPQDLKNNKDFCTRRCIPDHDAIAVDSPVFNPTKNKLCKDNAEYTLQFGIRKKLAIEHIKKVFGEWRAAPII